MTKIVFDASFLDLQTGIGQDSRMMYSELNEYFEVKILFPGSSLLSYRIRRKFLSARFFLTKKFYYVSSQSEFKFFQSQISSVAPKGNCTVWAIRVHDIFPLTNPEWFASITANNFCRQIRKAEKNNALIITSSEYTKKQILKHLPGLKNRVFVYPCKVRNFPQKKCYNCSACKVIKERKIQDKFFIAIGTVEPRKNYDLAIDFYESSSINETLPQLVVVGTKGWKTNKICWKLKHFSKNKILWLETCCDGALNYLFSFSTAFISFSKNEGFNLPAMEAHQIFQKPLILTDIAIHREYHSQHAYFFRTAHDLKAIYRKELVSGELIPKAPSKALINIFT